jgi:hypothetical protein
MTRLEQDGATRKGRAVAIVLSVGIVLALNACGGAPRGVKEGEPIVSSATSSQASPSAHSDPATIVLPAGADERTVVASVAGQAITGAEVRRQMVLKSPNQPVPPPPARLYREILREALHLAIYNRWLIGEARALHVDVSDREVQAEFEANKKSFPHEAEFEVHLKNSGETASSLRHEMKLGKLADRIFEVAKSKVRPASAAGFAAFVAAFRRRWIAQTDCRPGYVIVDLCRQFKGARPPADPYTLRSG